MHSERKGRRGSDLPVGCGAFATHTLSGRSVDRDKTAALAVVLTETKLHRGSETAGRQFVWGTFRKLPCAMAVVHVFCC